MTLCTSSEILEKALAICPFSMLENYFQEPSESLQRKWTQACEKIEDKALRAKLLLFGQRFGTASCELQQESIHYLLHEVEDEIRQQRQTLQQEGRLSCSMGMLFGAALAILLL